MALGLVAEVTLAVLFVAYLVVVQALDAVGRPKPLWECTDQDRKSLALEVCSSVAV